MGIYQITVTKFKPLPNSDASCQGYVVANNPTEAIELYDQIHGKIQPLDRFSMCQLAADFIDVAAVPKPTTAFNSAQAEALRRIAGYIESVKARGITGKLSFDDATVLKAQNEIFTSITTIMRILNVMPEERSNGNS